MRKFSILSLLIIISLFCAAEAFSKNSIAFGYLTNSSDDSNYNYLETIFPNSFASSIRNIFDVDILKPHSINEKLAIDNLSLKKIYYKYELKELVSKIGSDIFIYGSFTPLINNRIKIVLNLYKKNTDFIFSFTNIGKMETEIFKLVDRITQILISYMDREQIYRRKIIRDGANLAVLTNLNGSDLNSMYITLLEKGFSVVHFQGNQLNNSVDMKMINRFRYISTSENMFDYITDYRTLKFQFGTWAGPGHKEKVDKMRNIYKKYDYDFLDTKEDIIQKINAVYRNTPDYLLVVGFSDGKTSAWVRSIDLKSSDLIWMQSDIRGSSISDITKGLIERMSRPLGNIKLEED